MADLELPAWLGNYGPAGAMALSIVFGFIRGWLYSRSAVDRLIAGYEKQVKAAELREQQWRELAFRAVGQTDELLVTARVARATLAALPTDGQSDQA